MDRRRAGNVLVSAVMVVMAIAGVAKLLALGDFADSLRAWKLIPQMLVPVLTLAIPCAEVWIAAVWVKGGRGCAAAFVLLLVFTVVYAAHLLWGQDPGCNCFGKLMRIQYLNGIAKNVVPRNAILLAMLTLGMALRSKGASHEIPTGESRVLAS